MEEGAAKVEVEVVARTKRRAVVNFMMVDDLFVVLLVSVGGVGELGSVVCLFLFVCLE